MLFATIFVVPTDDALTVPWLTVATTSFSLYHSISLFVALLGSTSACNEVVWPTSKVLLVGVTVIPVTGTSLALTVTLHVAVFPFTVLAVIIASPTDFAVIVPPLTIATSLLLVDHVTVLSVELSGNIFQVNFSFSSTFKFSVSLFKVILIGFCITVILHFASKLPSLLLATIFVVPTDEALTVPWLTVATTSFSLYHSISLFVALLGSTSACNENVCPTSNVLLVGVIVIPLTGTVVTLLFRYTLYTKKTSTKSTLLSLLISEISIFSSGKLPIFK